MHKTHSYDICIIGAGAGGLSVASGAAQFGLKVALIEGHKMGGDCLNYGCVPSKALLSSAKHYYNANNSEKFGFEAITKPINIETVMNTVQDIIANIAPHDSVERFTSLGVNVYQGVGSFKDKNTVIVNDTPINAKYFVIATGSSPRVPSILGLNTVPYLTNETIFSLNETPKHLIVIGGGPIGCELGQAFAMLGIKVSIITTNTILPHDEAELVDILRSEMLNMGVNLYENTLIDSVKNNDDTIEIIIKDGAEQKIITGSHLLVATGRKPNLEKLNLNLANIKYNDKGIEVDTRLRTTNPKVFALGDAVGSYQFTHIASYHAGIVIRNIVFRQKATVDYKAVPWVTYTYPELAHVGLLEHTARSQSNDVQVYHCNYSQNDRAQTERALIGQVKLITNKKGYVLGVSILGLNAGELLAPWIDIINRKETVKALTKNIIPYPTLSDINKQVVGEYYKPILFSNKVKWVVRLLKLFW